MISKQNFPLLFKTVLPVIIFLIISITKLTPGNINAGTTGLNFQDQKMNDSTDSSTAGIDGPVVIYTDSGIISYSLAPAIGITSGFVSEIKSISKDNELTCYIQNGKREFSFELKDSIFIEPDEYELPEKMFIISDIEGNFGGFESILKGAKVIDENYNWIFGNGHLVLVGDFFDRGLNVTECLWLIYKLEDEAIKAGGKVHFILGNHELMNMRSDFRYVRNKYPENSKMLGLDYSKWYDKNSELGRWLRSKNSVEKIGNIIFTHGGISKELSMITNDISRINQNIRECIDMTFAKGEASNNIYIGRNGPLWYRGIAEQKETLQELSATLENMNAGMMIIGHTIIDSVKYLYGGKVIAIDLDHVENFEKGFMNGLYFENGFFYQIDTSGIMNRLKD